MSENHEPMFNFSEKTPAILGGVFIVFELLMYILPSALERLIILYGVLRPLAMAGTDVLSHSVSLIAHGFLHSGWGHVLMNTAMTIVFGIITMRAIRLMPPRQGRARNASLIFLMIFLMGVIVGGIFQWGWWAVSAASASGAVGASGGASALFATTGWAVGGRDKMLRFGLGWGVINIVMVLAEPLLGVSLAWAAHIGGYIGGMIIAPYFVKADTTGFKIT